MYAKTGKQPELIPNFIDTNKYVVRRLSGKPKTLCSIGNLLKTKGFEELLQAFSKLLSMDADLRLIIIGDGPEKARLNELSYSLGIAAKVQFTGSITPAQVREFLSQTDIFVSASHFETFGVSIVEAMACGIPVVATRCGGPEETVVKQAGLLCKKQDSNVLFDAILYVYQNYHQYLPEQIRAHVEKNYSREAVLRRQVNIYNQAIGKD
jgi:glycosyltransferase involved in cell wall biosynthesis